MVNKMSDKIKTFCKELHDLLEKHNVYLDACVSGDTHGVSTKFCVGDFDTQEEHVIVPGGSSIDASDIKYWFKYGA